MPRIKSGVVRVLAPAYSLAWHQLSKHCASTKITPILLVPEGVGSITSSVNSLLKRFCHAPDLRCGFGSVAQTPDELSSTPFHAFETQKQGLNLSQSKA